MDAREALTSDVTQLTSFSVAVSCQQVRFTETAERVRRERLLPRSLPPLAGKRVHLQPGSQRDPAALASLRRLVAALGAKVSFDVGQLCYVKQACAHSF